jgi:hypothetical protein
VSVSSETVTPETGYTLTVAAEVPGIAVWGILPADLAVLLTVAETRLVMGGTHYYTVFVSEFGAFKVGTVQSKTR